MASKTSKPPELDELCEARDCYHLGEDKGTYVSGRGYTSYYEKPIPCCMTRLLHGCPYKNDTRKWPDWDKDINELRNEIDAIKASRKAKTLMNKILKRYVYAVSTLRKNVQYLEQKLEPKENNDATR